MTFNEWSEKVKFGSECDRNKLTSFINAYENAKFLQQIDMRMVRREPRSRDCKIVVQDKKPHSLPMRSLPEKIADL